MPPQVAELVAAVGLPALAERIEEEAHWNRHVSLGEQQRLGIARALLHAPDYLFLDEATASLDEPGEAALYQLLDQRLPNAALVSIGHRCDAGRIPPPPPRLQPRRRRYRLRVARHRDGACCAVSHGAAAGHPAVGPFNQRTAWCQA